MKVELRKMKVGTPDPFGDNKVTRVQPWYLVLVGRNGEPIAVSEGYFSKWNAKRAARKNFPGIELVDTTAKPYTKHG